MTYVAIGPIVARADTFAPGFVCVDFCSEVPTPTAAGLLTFPGPTLDVSFDGLLFGITLNSADHSGDTYSWTATEPLNGLYSTSTVFAITDGSDGFTDSAVNYMAPVRPYWTGSTVIDGTLDFSPVPEPDTVTLMLIGLGLMGLTRKRMVSAL